MRISEKRRELLYEEVNEAIMELRIKSLKVQITEKDLFDLQLILWKRLCMILGIEN